MRKQRRRQRRGHSDKDASNGKDVGRSEVSEEEAGVSEEETGVTDEAVTHETTAATEKAVVPEDALVPEEAAATEEAALAEPAEPLIGEDLESKTVSSTDRPTEPRNDLDFLGRELERSLTGPTSAPPSRNATPEDILGLHSTSYEEVETSPPAAEESPAAKFGTAENAGPPPMEDFEERSAMAKEVLRATSDSRSLRRQPKADRDVAAGDSSSDEAEPDNPDEDVRFSEDLTISAKKRDRRKLFGR